MYFRLGKKMPVLGEVDYDLDLSHIERIIKIERPNLLYAVHDFYGKLKELQSQAAENPQEEKSGFNEVDREILHTLIHIHDNSSSEEAELSALTHIISIIVDIMNEINWPRHLR